LASALHSSDTLHVLLCLGLCSGLTKQVFTDQKTLTLIYAWKKIADFFFLPVYKIVQIKQPHSEWNTVLKE
jgi:hypothetical protein